MATEDSNKKKNTGDKPAKKAAPKKATTKEPVKKVAEPKEDNNSAVAGNKEAAPSEPKPSKKPLAKKTAPKKTAEVTPKPESAEATAKAITGKKSNSEAKPVAPKKAAATAAAKPRKAAAAKVSAIDTKVYTVHFTVKFHTKFGEQLFITANHPLFGNNNPDEAFPLSYLNEEYWHGYLQINESDFTGEPIVYNYMLKAIDGSYTIDWGKDKQLDRSLFVRNKIYIADAWNHPGYYENVFYTEPFKKVLLKTASPTAPTAITNFTHLFRCKAPLLNPGEVLCILGANPSLRLWNVEDPILMFKPEGKDYYEAGLDLSDSSFPLLYKYGVYNIEQQQFIRFETGNNRILYQQPEKEAFAIINDGFAILPNTGWKGAGVAIPVFSLRSENGMGVGEFNDIKLLVDWAKQIGLKLVQILPVNDTIATHSWLDSYPYSAISAFALNPLYINIDSLVGNEEKGITDQVEKAKESLNALADVDFDQVVKLKWAILKLIYPIKKKSVFDSADYKEFFNNNRHWLEPYGVFCYLRDLNGTADFSTWKQEHRVYNPEVVSALGKDKQAADEIAFHYYVQYQLHCQLCSASNYAHENGIILKGDIPIGIYRNSCDAWQQPELYHMDMQAGAPPDDFAVKGQNWGFPTYNWQKMREDGFSWWRRRFEQMSYYFDAFRIDHILGFFRIWSIPMHAVEGIMGHFVPAIPVHINEFNQRHIYFDQQRYCEPYITDDVLWKVFNEVQGDIKNRFLDVKGYGMYALKPGYTTQKEVEEYFAGIEDNEHNRWIKQGLFDLISNVILFEEEGSHGQQFHFRFGIEDTYSFQNLDGHTQHQLKQLYVNYFFERQDAFWRQEAMLKLPELKRATNMLICGEDLGMVPASVPGVMKDLGILSLEIQRMPKDPSKIFFHPADAPYLSVVTPSTHDMSTVRGWWEEDYQRTQQFYNTQLGQVGSAPESCEAWINKAIVYQHLYSPAMWSIFQLQDLMGMDESIRRPNADEERINVPSNPKHYWRYRMHLSLEQLMEEKNFNDELIASIMAAGR